MPKPKALRGTLRGFITITRAAKILHVAPMTLRRWDVSGKLKAYRHPFNGYRLYKKADLQALLTRVKRRHYRRAV